MADDKPGRNINYNQETEIDFYRAWKELHWITNPRYSRARGRPKNISKRIILEEIAEDRKT